MDVMRGEFRLVATYYYLFDDMSKVIPLYRYPKFCG